jgi:hypothetical protein
LKFESKATRLKKQNFLNGSLATLQLIAKTGRRVISSLRVSVANETTSANGEHMAAANGYALAFGAGWFFNHGTTIVVRVNYEKDLHKTLAVKAAEATLKFFRAGLDERAGQDTSQWPSEFRLGCVWDVEQTGTDGERPRFQG